MKKQRRTLLGFLFIVTSGFWEKSIKILSRAISLVSTAIYAFWLGVLKRNDIHQADELHYSCSATYFQSEYNKSGLFAWEKKALEKHFGSCKSLLVAGAGSGREVFALRKQGYDAYGFECNPRMVAFANELFEKEGMAPGILHVPPDKCMTGGKIYDGLILGWCAYMHIQGSDTRVNFLKDMRKQVKEGGPMLVSFWSTKDTNCVNLRKSMVIANMIRKLMRRELVEYGDQLSLRGYVHFFTREEIIREMGLGGFDFVEYVEEEHHYAVGSALPSEL